MCRCLPDINEMGFVFYFFDVHFWREEGGDGGGKLSLEEEGLVFYCFRSIFDYIQILCIHEYVDFSFTNVIFRCLEFLFKLSFVIDVIN